jgi:hypothetical protein
MPTGPACIAGRALNRPRPRPCSTAPTPAHARPCTRLLGWIRSWTLTQRRASFWSRYANWLSPAGLVGVGVAGIVTGMLVASMSVPLPMLSSEVLPSVFDQGDAEVVFSVNAEEAEQ